MPLGGAPRIVGWISASHSGRAEAEAQFETSMPARCTRAGHRPARGSLAGAIVDGADAAYNRRIPLFYFFSASRISVNNMTSALGGGGAAGSAGAGLRIELIALTTTKRAAATIRKLMTTVMKNSP